MKKFMYKKGFTLTELSLAMAFLSVILLTIAALIIFTTSIFQKGLAIKSVNNVGQDIIENLTRTITSSTPGEIDDFCEGISDNKKAAACNNSSIYFRPISFQQSVKIGDKNYPVSGAFCTGSYTYIWNTGYVFNGKYEDLSNYRATYNTTYKDFRLIRVSDSKGEICKTVINENSTALQGNTSYITHHGAINYEGNSNDVEELIQETDNSLAIYDFKVFKPDYDKYSGQSFFSGTFILATIKGDVDINVSGDFCKAPVDYSLSSDFSYCAINKFNFASRATGRSES